MDETCRMAMPLTTVTAILLGILQICGGVPLVLGPLEENTGILENPTNNVRDFGTSSQILETNKDIEGLIEGDIIRGAGRSATGCSNCFWPKSSDGVVYVPYVISSTYTSNQRALIIKSIQEISAMSCVRFVDRKSENDYLNITPGSGCSAYIGKTGGAQGVYLDQVGCMNRGSIQHEILHSLGFIHEHNRSDRDDYVEIKTENIQQGQQGNFQKASNSNNLGFPYDYFSLMHYDRKAFSGNGKDTIVPKGDPTMIIGQNIGISALDVAQINKLYNCNLCRVMVPGYNGTVTSGNYPSSYPDNTNCQYMVRVPDSQVFMEFKAFDVEASLNCASDYLRIYDGPNTTSPLFLDKACGSGQMPSLVSSMNAVLMEFVSNGALAGAGFKATFRQVTCGATYFTNNTMVTSPNYPGRYFINSDCIYSITAPAGYKVSLTFSFFMMEIASSCTTAPDYLAVHDGNSLSSPILGQFCSYAQIPPKQVSTGNSMLLHFVSNEMVNYPGYVATYTFVPNNGNK